MTATQKSAGKRENDMPQMPVRWGQKMRALFLERAGFRRLYIAHALRLAQKKGNTARIQRLTAWEQKLDRVKDHIMVKYIAKELFLYFFVCFLFFFVIFFVNQILLLAETILKMRVPIGSVMRLILYCLPTIVAQSAPFATLVGFLMCLGRMVTDNEILILRASGQRYRIILIPVLIMGILISLFSFIMNDYFLPLGTLNYNRMFKQIIQSNPAVEIESQSIKRMNDATLVIGMVEKNDVSDLVFFDEKKSENQKIIVASKSNVKKSTHQGVLMELQMNDVLVLLVNPKRRQDFDVVRADSLDMNIFESSIITTSTNRTPREMTSYDLYKEIQTAKKENKLSDRQKNIYSVEFNKKFSLPFGSIFFALLAFPLALVFGRKDGQTLGLVFGLIISVVYWAANILGQMFGLRGGYNGFWMMWSPNFFIGALGIILYLRLKKK